MMLQNCIQPSDSASVGMTNGHNNESVAGTSRGGSPSLLHQLMLNSGSASKSIMGNRRMMMNAPFVQSSSSLSSRPNKSSGQMASRKNVSIDDRHRSQLQLLRQFQQKIAPKVAQQNQHASSSHYKNIKSHRVLSTPEILAKKILKRHPEAMSHHNSGFRSRGHMTSNSSSSLQHNHSMNQAKKKIHVVQKSGHFQVSHPMFRKQQQSSSGMRQKIKPGLLSKGQHHQMSQMIQRQLQGLNYQPAPIAPIAPIKVTPAQVKAILDQKSSSHHHPQSSSSAANLSMGQSQLLSQYHQRLSQT